MSIISKSSPSCSVVQVSLQPDCFGIIQWLITNKPCCSLPANIPHVSMFREVLFCAIRKNSWLKFDGWITFLKPYLLVFKDDLFTSNELFFSCKGSSNNGAVGVCGCGFSSFSFY